MPLPVPNLDDKAFDQFAAEARALIPRYFPRWTDHNLSDPGITLLELFAFLFEAATYQINRVPERTLEHFARLVGVSRNPGEVIEETLRRAMESLREQSRAITATDIEFSIMKANFTNPALKYDHPAGARAVMMEISDHVTKLARNVSAGRNVLALDESAVLKQGDSIKIVDDDKTEYVDAVSVVPSGKVVYVWTTPPPVFDHYVGEDEGIEVKILSPIPETTTTLTSPAKEGDRIVHLKPIVQSATTGEILRLDINTVRDEYVDIHSIARAKAIIKVTQEANLFPDEQITEVIVVPSAPGANTHGLRQAVFKFLREHCLITTRVRVSEPSYKKVDIGVIVTQDHSKLLTKDAVRKSVKRAISDFLNPLKGGADGKGWEFGRPVFRSELCQLIEGIEGVDHIQTLTLNGCESADQVPDQVPSTSLVELKDVNVYLEGE